MKVPPTIPMEWLELSALVAAATVLLVLCVALSAAAPSLAEEPATGRRRGRRRACRAFAEAIARGDLEAADRVAAAALEPGGRPGRIRGARRRHRRAKEDVLGWDERKLFALPMDDVRRQFLDPAASASWFPNLERVPHGGRVDVVIGPTDPIRLTLVSETWTPGLDGLSFTAACAAFQITGHLTLRTVLAGTPPSGEMRTAVEVWIHMETTDSPQGRVALARARDTTRNGLARMAAELNPL